MPLDPEDWHTYGKPYVGASVDASQEPYWNLLQVLAWIQSRSLEILGKLSDHVMDHGEFEIFVDGKIFPQPADPPGFNFAELWMSFDRTAPLETPINAERLLIDSLAQGDLSATGYLAGDVDRELITPTFWIDARVGPKTDEATGKEGRKWHALRFERGAVVLIWTANERGGKISSAPTLDKTVYAYSEHQGKKWAKSYYAGLASAGKRTTREQDGAAFKAAFPKAPKYLGTL